jgi:hypothetical protein
LIIDASNKIDWSDGKPIILTSNKQLDQLITEGFEIIRKSFQFHGNLGGLCMLYLKKDNEKLIANATPIVGYAANFVTIYDFDKKKPVTTWVEDTSVYYEFEQAILMLSQYGNGAQIVTRRQLETAIPHRVYCSLYTWMMNERGRKYGIQPISEIFSLVCVVEEKDETITRRTFSKEQLCLSQISKIVSEAKHSDNTIALSPILLSKRLEEVDDAIIALMLYDIKNDRVLAFNIQTIQSSIDRGEANYSAKQGLHDIVLHLFLKCINQECECTSSVPLPFHSPWYTALPWICYVVLSQIGVDTIDYPGLSTGSLNITKFFTFGNARPPTEGYSFDYRVFAPNSRGRASCIMALKDSSDDAVNYTLRFDQHPMKPFVHMDFSFYDEGEEHKLISHRPLDLEEVYDFNHNLFFAMMFAGLFDGYFNTLIDGNLQGIQELRKRNPAFLCSLTHVWRIEKAISWLNTHDIGYKILEKLYNQQELNEEEQNLAKEMHIGDFSLVAENENHVIDGLTLLGNMVLVRYRRGQIHF